jgi:E3 ubiquitin-protein ligase TRIP12
VGVLCCVLQSIIAGLKQSDDENAQLAALSDLCEHLSISTEESLATFPVEQVVPLLVSMSVAAPSVPCTLSSCPLPSGSTQPAWQEPPLSRPE